MLLRRRDLPWNMWECSSCVFHMRSSTTMHTTPMHAAGIMAPSHAPHPNASTSQPVAKLAMPDPMYCPKFITAANTQGNQPSHTSVVEESEVVPVTTNIKGAPPYQKQCQPALSLQSRREHWPSAA